MPEVEEGSLIRYPELPYENTAGVERMEDDVDNASPHHDQPSKSPGGASTFSGTTARISGGQELTSSNVEDMIDALEDLSGASNKIISLLLPQEVSGPSVGSIMGRLSDMKSKEARQLQRYTPNFQAQRVIYGDEQYINAPAAVRAILDVSKIEDIRPGPWRMDPIFYQANLANLAISLLTQGGSLAEQITNELDRSFPRPFLQRFAAKPAIGDVSEGSALFPITLQVAVEIRTRFFVNSAKRLVDEPGFDPDELLQQIFYRDDGTLHGWSVSGLRPEDIKSNQESKRLIVDRLDQLRQTFSENEAPLVDFESLEKGLPQARLTTILTQWIQLRLQEIELQLQSAGGVAGIVQAVHNTSKSDRRMSSEATGENLSLPNNANAITLNYHYPSDSADMQASRVSHLAKQGFPTKRDA